MCPGARSSLQRRPESRMVSTRFLPLLAGASKSMRPDCGPPGRSRRKAEYVCPRLGTVHVQVTHDPEVSRTRRTPSGIRIGLHVGRMQTPELAVERESK